MAVGGPAMAQQAARPLAIKLEGEVVYDSNVARTDAATAALRGLSQSDVHFTPAVEIDLTHALGRESLFFSGRFGYDFYHRNHILNRERLDLAAGAKGQVGPCSGNVQGTYARHQSDLQDLSLGVVRNVESLSSVGFDTRCGRRIGLAPTFSLSQDWATNSSAQRLTSNHESLTVTGGLAYHRPNFGDLSVFAQYTRTRFPNRFFNPGPSAMQDGFSVYSGGVRYDRKLGARIEGVFALSYTSLNPTSAAQMAFSGLTYSADVTYRASSRLQAHISLERAVKPSNRVGTNYSTDKTYFLDGTYDLGSRIKLNLGVSKRTQRYVGSALVSGVDLTAADIKTVYGSVTYKVGRRITLNLDARREWRDAPVAAFRYASTRVGLSAGLAF